MDTPTFSGLCRALDRRSPIHITRAQCVLQTTELSRDVLCWQTPLPVPVHTFIAWLFTWWHTCRAAFLWFLNDVCCTGPGYGFSAVLIRMLNLWHPLDSVHPMRSVDSIFQMFWSHEKRMHCPRETTTDYTIVDVIAEKLWAVLRKTYPDVS